MEIQIKKSRIYNTTDPLGNGSDYFYLKNNESFLSDGFGSPKLENNFEPDDVDDGFSNVVQGVDMDQSKMDPRNWIYKASGVQVNKQDVGKFQVLKDKIRREFKRKIAEQKMQREYKKNLLEFNHHITKINTTVHETSHLLCSNFSLINYKMEKSDDQ